MGLVKAIVLCLHRILAIHYNYPVPARNTVPLMGTSALTMIFQAGKLHPRRDISHLRIPGVTVIHLN